MANVAGISKEKLINLLLGLRNRHFIVLDLVAFCIIPALALTLRVDGLNWWPRYARGLIFFTLASIGVKLPIYSYLGLYNRYWRYASVADLALVLAAIGPSTAALTAMFVGAHVTLARYGLDSPRSLPLLDGMLTCLAVAGYRFGLRGLHYWRYRRRCLVGGRRVLVAGAGEGGASVVREMRANPQLDMEPVAFVDDDPAKQHAYIQGLQVVGTCAEIPEVVRRDAIQRIIVAMPSVPLMRQREILAICEKTGVATHNLPGLYELIAGYKTISRLPQININHLLHREPVVIDQREVAASVGGATVLVTGAGGSIGSELCRQVARFKPAQLILLGHGENSICEISLDLRLSFPDLITHSVIVDVRDLNRVNQTVRAYRPNVIFHAAAHKHVPLMEADVQEAITNNVLGTWNVLRAAERYGVERLIVISTDKAVNPACTMGATKRMAELLTIGAARRAGRAYMAVRFGNVLGSRGSVIPIFQRQIAAGGPLTITHPDMCRYFMTIPEAVQLVLQASVLGRGGEVFVLDMGQPVRILDLATDLIELCGLKPERDIKIVYSGIRPGEKIAEELFLGDEDYQCTKHRKIFVANHYDTIRLEVLEQIVAELINQAQHMLTQADVERLRAILPQVCYYIDQYPSRQPLPEPTPRLEAGRPRPLLTPQSFPLGA